MSEQEAKIERKKHLGYTQKELDVKFEEFKQELSNRKRGYRTNSRRKSLQYRFPSYSN